MKEEAEKIANKEQSEEGLAKKQEMEKKMQDVVSNMKNIPDNLKDQLTTEVTSIASEEERTGEKFQMPTPEELVANSSMAIIANRKHLSRVLPELGKKALHRIIMASLDLPKEGEKVHLVGDDEKLAFRLMQSTIRAMYTVLFYHTSEEIIKKHNEEEQAKKEAESCNNQKEPNSQSVGCDSTKTEKQVKTQSTSQPAQAEVNNK